MINLNSPRNRVFQTPANELSAKHGLHRQSIGDDPFKLTPLLRIQRRCSEYGASYLHHPERDFISWQTSTLALLSERLVIPHTLGNPCEARLISRVEHPHYIVEEVEFTATSPLRVPATVVIPRNGNNQHPAVVALHSMGGLRLYGREKLLEYQGEPACLTSYRNTYYGGRSLQEELARAGFLSIAIDAFNFGLRTSSAVATSPRQFEIYRRQCTPEEVIASFRNDALLHEPTAVRALECAGISIPALIATDDLRTVDYLLTREDVDSERIGCVGFSLGGFRAHYLSTLSPHIRAAVSVCWTSTMQGIVGHNVEGAIGFFSIPPGLYQHLDPVDIIAASAPKPFLAISAWQDLMLQPSAMVEAHLFLRKCWKQAGVGSQFGSLFYNTVHEFNPAMQEDALAFLKQHLDAM